MIEFFINRPIFATVIALLMILIGGICIFTLPIAQFPVITPPQVSVATQYVGASAQVVADTVTTPLEEQINGVEGMAYMTSASTNNGDSSITITFDVGYDQDIAAVDVQNYANEAKPRLPTTVLQQGLTITKVSANIVLFINLYSPDGRYDQKYLSNYAEIHIKDVISRVPGVSTVTIFGLKEYSIRIWLDPNKLANLGLTASDVVAAVQEQNIQVAAGKLGQAPAPKGQAYQLQINAKGRLSNPKEFENIIIRAKPGGAIVRMKDVARVEMGAEDYSMDAKLNGQPTAAIAVYQLADANALKISKETHKVMDRLSKRFPKGLKYTIAYDTTMFVTESLKEVIITLFEAIALVVLVVFIFLQSWRATLIPCIAIPVSLIGTFALLQVMGFSINTLSLLGLVLAIGLVVDDAIVVVENVERQLEEGETNLRKATVKAMQEVRGPIIATTLVLMAVFIPVAFMPGMTGRLYNQFALTIAFSVGLSGINSLSLSPALCAVFLRKQPESKFFFFVWFNKMFSNMIERYKKFIRLICRFWYWIIIGFVLLAGLTYYLFQVMPTAFIPPEDQGYFIVAVQLPQAAALQRTQNVMKNVSKKLKALDGVQDVIAMSGFNLLDGVDEPNYGVAFVVLKPWSQRTTPQTQIDGLLKTVDKEFSKMKDAKAVAFNAPPIPGLGSTGGFQFEIQDLNGFGVKTLAKVTNKFVEEARKQPALRGIFTTFSVDVPQLYLELDRTKAKTLGLSISNIFETLQIYLGSYYVNQFNKYGRIYKVFLQAEPNARSKNMDVGSIYVRNDQEKMVPLSTLIKLKTILGPYNVPHYNLYTSATVNGSTTPGYSSGQAIKVMEQLAEKILPEGIGYEWTGTVYQQLKAGNLAPLIFMLSIVVVFLFLAALYESWSMPFMILLAVPLAMLGAAAALMIRGIALDIYAQIGLVMLIGLAAKNAILIVEFAKDRRDAGETILQSAIDAARLRLRPILMTAFAFILGALPLAIATGAGASSRHSIGTTVVGGMLVSTFLSLVVVPVFYVVIETMRERFWLNRGKHDKSQLENDDDKSE